jgi:hypothetical protein
MTKAGQTGFKMKSPIIVNGDGGVDIFLSVESAENYMEVIDVRNGEYYSVHDADAMPLNIKIINENKIKLESTAQPPEVGLVKKLLERMLCSIGVLFDENTSLNDLLGMASKYPTL